ncbi:hypothetical protein GDO78_014482 [Eleutherodactylus coqui]|uniref:VWFD domain-containing protein n=1 Tax=Eleutherodactylus coqui TaxID=57060 RepID=A0A8J6EES2_ELECQ|nr:hypothetical protein GDO78_014482 [Eleutherodactylus coqui]
MQNVLSSGGKLELLLTSFFPATKVNISLPRQHFTKVVFLTPGIPTSIELPKNVELLSSVRSNMTVHITSDKPISVVAINSRPPSTGAAVVSPISDWGSEYYLMTPDVELEGALGQIAIVNGPKPNFISVLLMGLVQFEKTTYLPGQQLNLTLGPWESVQLQTNQSLTASYLVSEDPVAVFAGLGCVGINGLCTHLYLQLPATSAWGSNFVIPPLLLPSLGKITILTASDTLVKLVHGNKTTNVIVIPGMIQETEVDETTSLLIGSLERIMVLLNVFSKDHLVISGIFYNVPSIENSCVAYAIISLPGFDNSVLLIGQEDVWTGLELDHKPLLGSPWKSIGTTKLVYSNLPLQDEKRYHFISNPGHDFGLATIGIGNSSVYAIPGICLDKEYLLCGFACTSPVCSDLGKTSSCASLTSPTCMMWGKTHLLTFYKAHMLLSELCPHVLLHSQGVDLSLQPFSVEIQPSSDLIVQIKLYDLILEVSNGHPGVVYINNEKLYAPISVHDGSINVTRYGFLATIINVTFGLRIVIGDHGFLYIQISQALYKGLSGDCIAQSSKKMVNSIRPKLFDSSLICELTATEDLKPCDRASTTAGFSNCKIMLTSEIFQSCHMKLDPKPFIRSCESEVCAGRSSCSAIESYALACSINNANLIGWRNVSNCGLQCPRHSHYRNCPTTCHATCVEAQTSQCTTSLCYDGCFCDEGFKISAESCVTSDKCGCYWQDSYYPKGVSLGKDCKSRCNCVKSNMECHQINGCDVGSLCELDSGLWSCHPINYVSCTLYSDSHFVTFDDQAYTFNRLCGSRMAGICSNYSGLEMFEVDGILVYTPYVVDDHLQIYKSNLGADVLQTDFGLVVSFDRMKRLLIKVPDSYLGSVCGLCASTINLVSDTSLCGQYCQGVCTNCSNELYHNEATTYCGLIIAPQGAFRDCYGTINPYPYFEACVNDVCSGSSWCPTLYAYAAACREAGAETYQWRQEADCGYACPPNSTYTNSSSCASSCHPTCGIALPLTCDIECQEGCQCDSGLILSGDSCVLPEDCGCYVDGRYWKRGDLFYDEQCQNQCSCLDGGIVCESHNCTSEERCTVVMGVRACYPLSLTCSVSDQSYQTLNGLNYPVHKNCLLVMAMVISTKKVVSFDVHLRRNVLSNGDLTNVQKVILKVYGYTMVLNLHHEGLEVNGSLTNFPLNLDNQIFGYANGSHKVLETDFGLQLTFNPSVVLLTIPLDYAGSIRGLCGNDAMASDDAADLPVEKLLSSWSSHVEYSLCNETLEHISNTMPAFNATHYCELLMEAEGPFQECHTILNPQGFYNNCLSALNEGYLQLICQSIQYYDNECQWAGATVRAWKTSLCDKTSCLFYAPTNFTWYDGVDFQSSSIECSLTLATVCSHKTSLESFSVSVHYEVLGNHTAESLHVLVNRMPVSLPASVIPGKLQIRLEGPKLILATLSGLVINYDYDGFILIQFPSNYQSQICGQCAQMEPLETRIRFTGEIAKNESENQCLISVAKESWTSNEDHFNSTDYCSLFLEDDGPFSDCHRVIKPDIFYNMCQIHVCQELQSGGNGDTAACHDLEEYVTLCQLQDAKIKPWRNESFCRKFSYLYHIYQVMR